MAKSDMDTVQLISTNKKGAFQYNLLEEYEAGIVLTGTEIKAIRRGKVSLRDAYCFIQNDEIFIKSLYISEYSHGTYNNHEERRMRKLLLKKKEIKKLEKKVKEKGFSIIPYQLYITDRGFAKLLIFLAQGKKIFDKRESLKAKDDKRKIDRMKKQYG